MAEIVPKQSYNRECFHCKTKIPIVRNEENDVVYFDKHYYHIKCFKDMGCVKKKCYCCKEDITISEINDDVVYYEKHYYHTSCFTQMCKDKNTKKWNVALDFIGIHLMNARNTLSELFSKKKTNVSNVQKYKSDTDKMINNYFLESDVDNFIKEFYGVVKIGELYSRYLSKIYDGSYKKLNGTKIPPEHLLDMWKQKKDYLNKVYQKNTSKGMIMTPEQRIAYDLSILIGKYNGYIEWLRNQQILSNDTKEIHNNIVNNINLKSLSDRIKECLPKNDITIYGQ